MSRHDGWRIEAACLGLVLLVGWPLLVGHTYHLDDVHRYYLPTLAALQRALLDGELLIWNTEAHAGYPAVSTLEAASYYPLNWLACGLLPVVWAMKLLYLLHYWLLARGVLGFVRELGGSRRAALIGAAVALLGGTTNGHSVHLGVIVAMGWTGPILWLSACALRRPRPAVWILLLGACHGLSLLGGHPQYLWFGGLASLCLVPWARGAGVSPRDGALRLLAGGALGVILGAAVVLPVYEFVGIYPRIHQGGTQAFLAGGGATLPDFVRFLHPDLLGPPPPATHHEVRGFCGAAFLLLALAGLLRPGRDPLARTGAALALVGLLLLVGGANPLYRLLVYLPPFSLFKTPARHVWLLQLGVAALAASGADALLRGQIPRRRARQLVVGLALAGAAGLFYSALQGTVGAALGSLGLLSTGVAAVVGAAALLGSGPRAHRLSLAVAAGLIELSLTWHAHAETIPDALLVDPPPLAAPILASDQRRTLELEAPYDPTYRSARRLRGIGGGIWGVPYFTGQESLAPLAHAHYVEKLREALHRSPRREFPGLCARYSIRWIVTGRRLDGPLLRAAGEDDGSYLYENPGARPMAYALLNHLLLPEGVRSPAAGPAKLAPVEVVRAERTRWVLRCRVSQPAAVVLAQSFYPGWVGTVDGRPAQVHLAEDLFMAVEVPAGEHTVELAFDNAQVYLGRQLSLVAWLAWLAGLLWCFRGSRGRSAPPST